MREALVILVVMLALVVLTAIRYRKQIAGMIQIARALKSARDQLRGAQPPAREKQPLETKPLVNCARCGTWVPQDRAISLRGGTSYCSTACPERNGSPFETGFRFGSASHHAGNGAGYASGRLQTKQILPFSVETPYYL